MVTTPELVYQELSLAGIYGPSSKETRLYENRLERFFAREYQRYSDNPVSLQELGISTDSGPIMEDTESLMVHHYDEDLNFFRSFLDKRYYAYSMAYYGDTPDSIRQSVTTLEDAQQAKFELISERAEIEGHERIFNIGCGFGSLETYLLGRFPNIEITGITPSKVQVDYLKGRMQDPHDPLGSGRFTLIENNIDSLLKMRSKTSRFNIVISIGSLEHSKNMMLLLNYVYNILKPNGKTFHHFITSRHIIPQFLDPKKTRIGLYFPGGRVWPQAEFARHTEHFELVGHWFVNGLNYWRTLEEWHKRFWSEVPSLRGKTFDMNDIMHWNDYFSLCKAVFPPMDGTFYGNSHYLFRSRH